MTRFVGMAMAAVLALAAGSAAAQEVPRVKVTRGQDRAVIALDAGRLQVTQTVTRNAIDLTLADTGDLVRLIAGLDGEVTVHRGDTRHAFNVRRATATDRTVVGAMLAASRAVRSFQAVMQSPWAQSARAAEAFRGPHALLGTLGGEVEPLRKIAESMASPAVSLMRVRRDGPDACWSAYSRDVLQYTYDLEGCVKEAEDSYFPLHLAWCAYEYDIKTSLAFVWMLDCYSLI